MYLMSCFTAEQIHTARSKQPLYEFIIFPNSFPSHHHTTAATMDDAPNDQPLPNPPSSSHYGPILALFFGSPNEKGNFEVSFARFCAKGRGKEGLLIKLSFFCHSLMTEKVWLEETRAVLYLAHILESCRCCKFPLKGSL
ncbi:hypothetical protein NPIL_508821 [Nephila pilipes]|uniref:Uncharacterized protein n=1 Tax=Nephila pilipes TaxID=299642 RepID=A0A8X6P740_NEPPI|nr:hypothetical protein NPIL_508821 [Nephila pilipes]